MLECLNQVILGQYSPAEGTTLVDLGLVTSSYQFGAAQGTPIGTITGKATGSTITSLDTRLQVNGNILQVGSSGGSQPVGTFTASLRETLTGALNTPHDTVVTVTVVEAPPVGLQPFVYEAEAQAYFSAVAAAGVTYTDRRKYTINRMYKRLKAAGIYTKITAAWLLAQPAGGIAASYINLITPGTRNLSQGTSAPNFVENVGLYSSTGSATQRLNTGVRLSDLGQNNWHMGVYVRTNGASANEANSIMGAYSGSAGITVAPNRASATPWGRGGTATEEVIGAASSSDGTGLTIITRPAADYFRAQNNSRPLLSPTGASVGLPSLDIYLLGANNNGAAANGTARRVSFATLGASLTEDEATLFYAIVHDTMERIEFGDIAPNEPGFLPASATADVIVYGATVGGVLAAYEAKRQGRSVILVGGWRERQLGGMLTGGLNAPDFTQAVALQGLPRWMCSRATSFYGTAFSLSIQARFWNGAMRSMFDPARLQGLDIPIYWSTGVTTTTMAGTRLNSFETADGRIFSGRVFIDASYEGDLFARSNVTYVVGREQAGTGAENSNGAGYPATGNPLDGAGGASLRIDPWNIPGDSSSGPIRWVRGLWPGTTGGTGDAVTFKNRIPIANTNRIPQQQAYNFRLTMTQTERMGVPISTTPPPGYSDTDFELLFRWLDAYMVQSGGSMPGFSTVYTPVNVGGPGSYADVNQGNGLSSDNIGWNWDYCEATYAAREAIWQDHIYRIKGALYAYRFSNDYRALAATTTRTSMLTWRHAENHYCDPYPTDTLFWPYQMYVREGRRMVSDFILDANDVGQANDATLRSDKTIGVTSYPIDSHAYGWYAVQISGQWDTEPDNMRSHPASSNSNGVTPIPYDCVIPKSADCTNILVPWGLSATHLAYGAYRMELALATVGQGCGMAAAIAVEQNIDVQAVDYATLRTRLLASNVNPGETSPYLPQLA